MRAALIGLIALHGLIHLIGPAKAFGWAEMSGLRMAVSPAGGVLWLLVALLFFTAAIVAMTERPFPAREWWWVAALPAVVVSQSLIVQAWQDARIGTIATAAILIPALIAALQAAPDGYRARYAREVTLAKVDAGDPGGHDPSGGASITEHDLLSLPRPVQAYLRFAGVVGRPRVRNFRIRFTGAIRDDARSPWMPTIAEQYSTLDPKRRLFIMRATRMGVPFEALHVFKDPAARFEVTVAGAARIVNAHGPELDQSETVTMLNDMCLLAPATLIDPAITWSDVTEGGARVTFAHEGRAVSATLTFGADGALLNFESDDRYRLNGPAVARERWSTPVQRYGLVDGITVPVSADALWSSAASGFTYAHFEIRSVAYNAPLSR